MNVVSARMYQHSRLEFFNEWMADTNLFMAYAEPMLRVQPLSRITKVGFSSGLNLRDRPFELIALAKAKGCNVKPSDVAHMLLPHATKTMMLAVVASLSHPPCLYYCPIVVYPCPFLYKHRVEKVEGSTFLSKIKKTLENLRKPLKTIEKP